ncbi:TRAFAC clade GTPase domain-containing protein [Microvirga puerhi]|uniref:Double-GTPase 2 domain-containing protein n=1 Tax=Microvirga puerhi TaxID=2876078 RepID=A0ABS7VPU8_9HYPH|nr:hypothetical protein [Microvirga puerhi]MBZ6077576.1 hypothetical protein [Microvirga puerhi]
MADERTLCRNAECGVVRTGVCVLGNDPIDSCPEYDPELSELDQGDEEDSSSEPTAELTTRLRSSEILLESDVWPLRKAYRTNTVSLVGDVKSGKTTLIASLYALFCKGPFSGFSFRGSRTLTGFARRHHLALEKSGREVPTTPRTSMNDGVGFFHLDLSCEIGGTAQLLISDRSGEAFQSARVNTAMVDELRELRLSDRVCFLLDAEKLTQVETRASYRREFKQMIWALIQNGAFSTDVKLEVLTTKIDKLTKREDEKEALIELEEYENGLSNEFKKANVRLDVFRICALPRANYKVGLVGLEELVKRWLAPTAPIDTLPLPAVSPARAFDRLLEFWSGEQTSG